MKFDDLIKWAALGIIGYIGYGAYKKTTNFGQGVSDALADTAWNLLHSSPLVTKYGSDADVFRVIGGGVYHIVIRPTTGITMRAWNWSTNAYVDLPGMKPPAGWENAPAPLPKFWQLKAAGRPWYSPWSADQMGLNASLQLAGLNAARPDTLRRRAQLRRIK